MNHPHQKQSAVVGYPPQPAAAGPYVVPPPPVGYPTKDDVYSQNPVPVETKAKGGFWKGCCAALCCCCLLDACF